MQSPISVPPHELVSRLGITVALIAGVLIVGAVLRAASNALLETSNRGRAKFWTSQTLHLLTLAGVVVAIVGEWSDQGRGLATFGGWMAAGLAIALQRVVTAFAGYLIILRGNIFTVGDRITIGGVRGDVVALGFMQTTVMEMGEAPGEKGDDPSMWIHGRQYSGRLVRVTNDKIFDTPIYNYTREFPYIWEEIMLPIRYADDYRVVERIMLDVARRHTEAIVREAEPACARLQQTYFLRDGVRLDPAVYIQLTDNWVALSVRFLTRDHDVRGLKTAMYREMLAELDRVKIGIASGTYAIVEVPPLVVKEQ